MMHTSEYLSPASLLLPDTSLFDDFPPMFIVYGGAERLSNAILVMWDRLQASRRANDCLMEMPDAVHDFMIFPWQAEEAAIVYERLDEWLREVLATEDVEDFSHATIAERRRKRRASLRIDRSPIMRPLRRESGVIRMIGDLQGEGMRWVYRACLNHADGAA
jgi:hypothetical protein